MSQDGEKIARPRQALRPAPGPEEEAFAPSGLHHVTAISGNPQLNLDFYTRLLGLRLVKVTVNFERPTMYQLYYGNAVGQPGTILSFLCKPDTAKGSRGTSQATSLSFAIPEDALPFWTQHLIRNGIVVSGPYQRFGNHVLSFVDPDGLQIDLVAYKMMETRNIWQNEHIPPDCAIRGLHSVSIAVVSYEAAADLLQQGLGFQQIGQIDNRYRYQTGAGQPGALLDVVHLPSVRAGTMGAGSIHHVGWRTAGEAQQLHWRYRLGSFGLNPGPVIDRLYFRACYFRGPGGSLFNIATDMPGFLLDEMPEELGSHLMLPPWLESQRSQLIQVLPPLRLPTSEQEK